jgi:hypothetical protein
VKVRDACKPRETKIEPAVLGVWRTAPINAELVQRELAQSTFNTTFAFSPQCDRAAGEVATGGGCVCDTVGKLTETRMSGNGWYCVCDQPDTIVAYAICTKLRVAVCGNGVAEPPGEDCDGDDVARCGPGAFGCTSSCTCLPLEPTRCCEIEGGYYYSCFDAATADAQVSCPLVLGFGATLAPEGEFCDAGRCGPERRPGAWCCQCPVPSPPFPHPQLCLDFASASEFDCRVIGCTLTVGAQCGAVTGTCGGP